jgi:hypothetical protein
VCRAVSRQRLGKDVPAATDIHTTIEVLLETVFSIWSVLRCLKQEYCSRKGAAVKRVLEPRSKVLAIVRSHY